MSDWYFEREQAGRPEDVDGMLPVPKDQQPGGRLPTERPISQPVTRRIDQPPAVREGVSESAAARRPAARNLRPLAAVLRSVPWFVYSGYVIWVLVGELLDGRFGWFIFGAWLIAGLPLAWLPTERWVPLLLRRLRSPSNDERALLNEALLPVAHLAGVDATSNTLRIEQADRLSSVATAGRTLCVTQWALRTPSPFRSAAIAHELGRLVDLPWFVRRVLYWYSAPARAVVWTTRSTFRGLFKVSSIFGWLAATAVLVLVTMGFAQAASDPLLALIVSVFIAGPWLLAWLSRLDGMHADRTAASLGFGQHLADLLLAWQETEAEVRPSQHLPVELLRPQASAATRIAALERRHRRVIRRLR